MFVEMEGRGTCQLCRGPIRWIRWSTVRVNRNSLRDIGTPILVSLDSGRCVECGRPDFFGPERMVLAPDDADKVRAYRAKKWPAA